MRHEEAEEGELDDIELLLKPHKRRRGPDEIQITQVRCAAGRPGTARPHPGALVRAGQLPAGWCQGAASAAGCLTRRCSAGGGGVQGAPCWGWGWRRTVCPAAAKAALVSAGWSPRCWGCRRGLRAQLAACNQPVHCVCARCRW
jgi:hypothetical protein